jgi:hypothetical protein
MAHRRHCHAEEPTAKLEAILKPGKAEGIGGVRIWLWETTEHAADACALCSTTN